MGALVPGSPATGLRRWGGGASPLGTWDGSGLRTITLPWRTLVHGAVSFDRFFATAKLAIKAFYFCQFPIAASAMESL
jgi:hypothetical protein